MSRIRVAVTIAAPRERVWEALEDIETHTRWMADAVSITFTSPQRSGRGTTFDCLTRIGPFALDDTMEVTRWEPGRTMGVMHRGVVSGTGEFRLRRRGLRGRRTRFIWAEKLRFPWWLGGPVGAFFAAPIMWMVWRGNVRRLRDLVESGAL